MHMQDSAGAILFPMQSSPQSTKTEPVGPFVGIILVILIILLGGVYFFLNEQSKLRPAPPMEATGQA